MHVSSHLGCMCLCILVACIFASLETLEFSELFCNHFERSNDPCIFTSWLRASLHVGCGHLRLMIVATILTASWLHASFWGWWLLLQFWLLIWYCNFNQRVKCISKWRLGMSSTLSIIIKRSLILPSLFALGLRYCERLSAGCWSSKSADTLQRVCILNE